MNNGSVFATMTSSFMPASQEFHWVFAYGSLMWRPDFQFLERCPARVFGYHRSFCVLSHVHRGTRDRPGLVFGLDRGGSCRGLVYKVAPEAWNEVRANLRAREQVTMIYREVLVSAHLIGAAGKVKALAYVVDPYHEQYAGRLPFDDQVRLIVNAEGRSGENPAYLQDMVVHLEEMGVRDEALSALWKAVSEKLTQ